MFKLLLLVSCLILLSLGLPVEDVRCPALPCPLPPCDNPHPTYYHYHGKLCQGCSQCNSLPKRQLNLNECPIIDCADPRPCRVPMVSSTITINGRECVGCPRCPETEN